MDTLSKVEVLPCLQRFLQHLSEQSGQVLDLLRHVTLLQAVIGGLVGWVVLVRTLRWRRYNAIHREFGAKYNNGLGSITPQDAQKIMQVSTMYDMPLLLNYSLAFALFKTYGIPSISKLLAATKQLKSKETISRRYADTEILVATWVGCPISGFLDESIAVGNTGPDPRPADDPRAMIALARVNWLHSKYKISNGDYLYTLCLFTLEPARWAATYGWRPLSPLERHAFYVFWAEIGRKMGIQDIPESFEGMISFAQDYERTHMMQDEVNKEVAGYTLDELLVAVPDALGLKTFGQRVSVCLMEEPLRVAMLQPEQPRWLHAFVDSQLAAVAFIQRWFLLPRCSYKWPIDVRLPKVKPNATTCPRLHPNKWAARPWYMPEATGLGYYRNQLLVAVGWYSEMPGPHLKSTGYRIEELGPSKFENTAHEEIMRKAAELQGCPIVGPWSLEGRKHADSEYLA
ncbi:hypothetical protein B0H34DRAFT_139014 [Crassisporium funariophilum]|nr:hypothetical protein B0H34DRAFT_139014 [Crassisporium funariophilum]